MEDGVRIHYVKRFIRYGLPQSANIIQTIKIGNSNYEKIKSIIQIWEEIEKNSKKDPFLYEKFREVNTIFFCGIIASILNEVINKSSDKIDTNFQDPERVFDGYAEANVIIGDLSLCKSKNISELTELNIIGLVLLKLKESQEKEITQLIENYNGGKAIDEYFLYPDYNIDRKDLIYINGTPNRISIRRIRNGIGHSNVKIDDDLITITDDFNPDNKYEIKMSHTLFKKIVTLYYFEIGMICALNDLFNLIAKFEVPYGLGLSELLMHLRKKGYRVPKSNWDEDELK